MSARDKARHAMSFGPATPNVIEALLDAVETDARTKAFNAAADHMAWALKDTPEYGPWVAEQLRAMAAAPAGPCCDVTFVGGGQCTKAAGHRTPQNQDPHTPAAAPVPDETADHVTEFAVRWPDGSLTRASDREHGLRAVESARRAEPGAVLMQRSCTPWMEVPS